ncbi:MAG: hypothetical protein RR513_08325 [Muribaculaceae bacterium]
MQIEKSLLYQRILIVAFWIYATTGFIFDEIMPFALPLRSPIILILDIIIVILGFSTLKNRNDIIIILAFFFLVFVSSFIANNLSLFFVLNGMRDFIPFMFLIPIYRYFNEEEDRKERFIKALDKALLWFLIVQGPCLLFQFLKYGANDHGGGSLGNWGSGIITTLIYLISFYLINKRIDKQNLLRSLWDNKLYILLLIPSFLNETKIGFIFILMYFFLLLPLNRKIFLRVFIAMPFTALFLWLAAYLYSASTAGYMGNVFSIEYYTQGYLLAQDDDGENYAKWLFEEDSAEDKYDIPRFTKLLLLQQINEEHPGHILLGFGVGHFKGGTILAESDIYKEYEWLFFGSMIYLMHVYIQLGIIGMILIALFWIINFAFFDKKYKRDYNLQLFLILTIVLIGFYNDSFRNLPMTIVFMYILSSSISLKDDEENIIEE